MITLVSHDQYPNRLTEHFDQGSLRGSLDHLGKFAVETRFSIGTYETIVTEKRNNPRLCEEIKLVRAYHQGSLQSTDLFDITGKATTGQLGIVSVQIMVDHTIQLEEILRDRTDKQYMVRADDIMDWNLGYLQFFGTVNDGHEMFIIRDKLQRGLQKLYKELKDDNEHKSYVVPEEMHMAVLGPEEAQLVADSMNGSGKHNLMDIALGLQIEPEDKGTPVYLTSNQAPLRRRSDYVDLLRVIHTLVPSLLGRQKVIYQEFERGYDYLKFNDRGTGAEPGRFFSWDDSAHLIGDHRSEDLSIHFRDRSFVIVNASKSSSYDPASRQITFHGSQMPNLL